MDNGLAASHRFQATFFGDEDTSAIDMRFQRISGLSRQLEVTSYREGGNNVGAIHFPERVTHGNLVLERGVMRRSTLTDTFNAALNDFQVRYMTVLVMLLATDDKVLCSWRFDKALPVSWSTGDLDANSNSILINTFEIAYGSMTCDGDMA